MRYRADLHVHSKYSRATSPKCDLFHLAWWARRKGIDVVGTGDFTHPAWLSHLEEHLVPAEPGLYRLRGDLEGAVTERLEGPCRGADTRFLLSVEVSTIYQKDDRQRKVHHLIYVPHFEAARRIIKKLATVADLGADGRPNLGLDSRHLLEMVLESDPGSYLVPAHVWTPWYGLFGSRTGFDALEDCYGDLAPHIFALETGLSSDPSMNWRLSSLDRYRLLSCSDAHSPPMLGRETTVFDGPLDYYSLRRGLETGEGLFGTLEFFPEEGKYHLDGHRNCRVRLEPSETEARNRICPSCGRRVTVGVLHRVDDLADRGEGFRPENAASFKNLVPLPEVLGELSGVSRDSVAVEQEYRSLLSRLGPELFILEEAPIESIARVSSSLMAEAITRMREGRVIRQAGYDGEYGTIRLFTPEELRRRAVVALLFEEEPPKKEDQKALLPKPPEAKPKKKKPAAKAQPVVVEKKEVPEKPASVLDGLDPDQRSAAEIVKGPLLIIAGPGTGKTRTLTHRMAYLVREQGVSPERILAITFTRRAADEMRERLASLLGEDGEKIRALTFHSLGLSLLREFGGLSDIGIATDRERTTLLAEGLGLSKKKAGKLLAEISKKKRSHPRRADAIAQQALEAGGDLDRAWSLYEEHMNARNLVDFDDLVARSVELLEANPEIREKVQEQSAYISVDEFQDVDERQYKLLLLLAGEAKNVCAIGDPDQAIYGFRGSDVSFFFRFREDYPAASVVRLGKNYRSTRTIVDAALGVIAPSPTLGERVLRPLSEESGRIVVHAAKTENAEAEWVVHSIERLIGGTSLFSFDSGRVSAEEAEGNRVFSDVAILYRTESQAEALAVALRRAGMPCQRRTHEKIAERLAAMAITKALDMPEGVSLTNALQNAARTVREDVAAPVKPALEGAMEHAATLDAAETEETFGEAEVDAALGILLAIAERVKGDRRQFELEVLLEVEVDTLDPRADRISLLTLHASKGLEFPVVFIVGCEDGLIPLRFPGGDDSDVTEERRLFYVGMTRARERLFLTYAERRARFGKVRESMVSPFLREIEERLVDHEKASLAKRAADPARKQLTLF